MANGYCDQCGRVQNSGGDCGNPNCSPPPPWFKPPVKPLVPDPYAPLSFRDQCAKELVRALAPQLMVTIDGRLKSASPMFFADTVFNLVDAMDTERTKRGNR